MKRIIGIPFSKTKSGDASKQTGQQQPPPPVAQPPASQSPEEHPQGQETLPFLPTPPPPPKQPGWLSRLTKKAPAPPGLPDLVNHTDAKVEDLERKIAQCETELKVVSIRLRKMPEGTTKTNLKGKAQGIVQRKKRYEQQAETLRQQSFNIEQTNTTLQSTKDAVHVVAALKTGVKELKKEQKKVNLESVEDLHDELEDLYETSEEVQDILASNLKMPIIDDKELEEQLELLGDDFVADNDASYLDEAIASSSYKNDMSSPQNTLGGRITSFQNMEPNSSNNAKAKLDPHPQDPSSGVSDILFDSSKWGQ